MSITLILAESGGLGKGMVLEGHQFRELRFVALDLELGVCACKYFDD